MRNGQCQVTRWPPEMTAGKAARRDYSLQECKDWRWGVPGGLHNQEPHAAVIKAMDLSNDLLSPVKLCGDYPCLSRGTWSWMYSHMCKCVQGKTCDLWVDVISVAILSPRQAWRGSFHPSPHFRTNSLRPSFIIPPLTAPPHSLATFRASLSSLVPHPTSFVCLCFISSSYLFTSSPSFICSPCAIHPYLSLAFFLSLSDVSVAFLQWLMCTLPWCRLLEGNTRLCHMASVHHEPRLACFKPSNLWLCKLWMK